MLYGVAFGAGGDCSCGVVFSLSLPGTPGDAWTETILWAFGSVTGDGKVPQAGLAIANGVLYGTTSKGGRRWGYRVLASASHDSREPMDHDPALEFWVERHRRLCAQCRRVDQQWRRPVRDDILGRRLRFRHGIFALTPRFGGQAMDRRRAPEFRFDIWAAQCSRNRGGGQVTWRDLLKQSWSGRRSILSQSAGLSGRNLE